MDLQNRFSKIFHCSCPNLPISSRANKYLPRNASKVVQQLVGNLIKRKQKARDVKYLYKVCERSSSTCRSHFYQNLKNTNERGPPKFLLSQRHTATYCYMDFLCQTFPLSHLPNKVYSLQGNSVVARFHSYTYLALLSILIVKYL